MAESGFGSRAYNVWRRCSNFFRAWLTEDMTRLGRYDITLTRSPSRTLLLALIGLLLAGVAVLLPVKGWAMSGTLTQVAQVAQASPASIDTLRQQRQQLERQRSTLNQQRDRLDSLEDSAKNRLDGLQDRITNTATQIKQNEAKLKDANTRLTALQKDLIKFEKAYQAQQFSTVARLRFLQRQQGSRGFAVLLQSQDLNDFIDRRYQLRRVYQSDRDFMERLKQQAAELNRRRRTVERQKNDVALLTQELLADKTEYEQQANFQASLIGRLQKDQQALEEAEDQLARDSGNIANLIRQRLSDGRNRVVIRGTGVMSLPSDGPLTSNFGYRQHPILRTRRFHAGIDFGAPYGSTIRAADDGVVIFAGWYGGYGRAIIIDHGGSTTTLYGHTSRVYVSEGQRVQRGQAIAAVGSTGFSTGPHLHFEVRKNGDPVNPLNFL